MRLVEASSDVRRRLAETAEKQYGTELVLDHLPPWVEEQRTFLLIRCLSDEDGLPDEIEVATLEERD